MKHALELADPVLLEPIMLVTLSVPEDHVGDVIGDLNSRRGHPLGMEAVGAMTEITAEAPMAEMLTYAPDLRSITQGQGDYTLEFLRYEEVPGHLVSKVMSAAAEQLDAVENHMPQVIVIDEIGTEAEAMAARTIVTSQPDVECDVCERRLLRGEQPDVFIAAGRRRIVCELCAPRAAHEGWMRESDSQSLTLPPLRPRRGRSFFERLRQVGKQPGEARDGLDTGSAGEPDAEPYDLFADAPLADADIAAAGTGRAQPVARRARRMR